MNEENDLNHNLEGDAVEGSVSIDEVVRALEVLKTRTIFGSSNASLQLIAVSMEVVMVGLCQSCRWIVNAC